MSNMTSSRSIIRSSEVASSFPEVFGGGGLFEQIFSSARGELWTSIEGGMRLQMDVPGVEPKSVRVQRSSSEIMLVWTDRHGANQERRWAFHNLGAVGWTVVNGVLTLDVKGGTESGWTEVPQSL